MKNARKRAADLFAEFVENEKNAGYLLILCTIISMTIANSSFGQSYIAFWKSYIDLSVAGLNLKLSIGHWINDGFMAVFFLLIGLEIERELYAGELSSVKKASLPLFAAVGGMLIPAAIYAAINNGSETIRGFGIPMATDIAFVMGMLALLGRRVPVALKIFLTALAIIDDLGAILIIAFFYTSNIAIGFLAAAVFIFLLMLLLNRLGFNRLWVYLILGSVMWYCMLQSGIHATIAGVLLAFAIPFRKNTNNNISLKLQHNLHVPVAYIILPLFALANTAIAIPSDILGNLATVSSAGIIAGLVIGKPVGILLFTYLAIRIGAGQLPAATQWVHIISAACLAGIGFTMSIFITNLAFSSSDELITSAKLSIIIASILSGVIGFAIGNMAVATKPNSFKLKSQSMRK